jgi:phage gpG-like protein
VTPAELAARLQAMRDRLREQGARDAANAMALATQCQIVRSMKGPAPSAPGSPPARRTGTLARSLRVKPAQSGGDSATARLAPHTVYARIQQLGGTIRVVRAKVLTDGKRVFGKQVTLPARPYMKVSGKAEVRRAAVAAVQRVIRNG